MGESPIGLNINRLDGGRTLALSGDIDLHTVGQLDDVLRELGDGGDITLELSDVSFMDSFGLRTVLATHESLQSNGHQLKLTNLSPAVQRLLEITHLLGELSINQG